MKIVNIFDKEYVLKFNVGVLRRATKNLKMTTPQIFSALQENNIDVVYELIYQCVINTHKDFDRESLDELNFLQFQELVQELAEVISEDMPESKKKVMKKKK